MPNELKPHSSIAKDVTVLLLFFLLAFLFYKACEADARRIAAADEARLELYSKTADVVYEVGIDIDPGLYRLEANHHGSDLTHCEVSDKETGERILYLRDTFDQSYVELTKGQKLTVGADVLITPVEMEFDSHSATVSRGWNIVGIDCREGVYKLNSLLSPSYYVFYKDANPLRKRISGDKHEVTADGTIAEFHNGDITEFVNCFGIFERELDDSSEHEEETLTRSSTPSYDRSKITVYITRTGSRYHTSSHCTGLNNANEVISTTLGEAEDMGFTPCKRCH